MRDAKRLAAVRSLPCVKCGHPDSQAAHSNWSEHGKGRGIKADDQFTIPLCHSCHTDLDQYKTMGREESKAWFMKMLERTNRMLSAEDKEVF